MIRSSSTAQTQMEPSTSLLDDPPSVTAVVLNHNGRHLLEVILPSLADQTYRSTEVLVVDDASRDDSLAYLAERWPEVRVVATSENVGVAAALNRGVEAARGEFVALLNNDLELDREWISEMVRALRRYPEAGSAAGKLLNYYQRDLMDSAGDGMSRSMLPFPRGGGERDRGQYDFEEEILSATAGAAMYRMSAVIEVGLFDESFFAYFEDVDWGLRAQLAGFPCRYVPTAIGYHMKNATTGGAANPRFLLLVWRNLIGVIVKNLPLSLLLRNVVPIARQQLGTLLHSVRTGTLLLYLTALGQALSRLPRWAHDRRRIQAGRRIDTGRLNSLFSDQSGRDVP